MISKGKNFIFMDMKDPGPPVLYLIPVPVSGSGAAEVLPPGNLDVIGRLQHFVVEDLRTARRMLRAMGFKGDLDKLHFSLLNEHTQPQEVSGLLSPMREGASMGIMSEAGMPAIADPGSRLVRLAHSEGFIVKPLTGPSSVFLALAASGMNGQQFCFHGYLPVKKNERLGALREIERRSAETGESQVFMETPYRNMPLLEDIVAGCREDSLLCIAADVTGKSEFIATRTVGEWKGKLPGLHKIPAIFILMAQITVRR